MGEAQLLRPERDRALASSRETARNGAAMTTIETPSFTLEVPDFFEKVLLMGQLVRLERMDRAEGEASFAEGNLFLGFVEEEHIPAPPGIAAGALLERLWEAYIQSEARCQALPADALQEVRSSGDGRIATLRLAATDWRPESGHVAMLRVLPARGPAVFVRFVLEFDWALRDVYIPLAHAVVDGLRWRRAEITSEDIEQQRSQVWSIFDEMPAARHAAILARYREILEGLRLPEVDRGAEPVGPPSIDLRGVQPEAIDLAFLRRTMAVTGDGDYTAEVRVAFFEDPVPVEFFVDDEYALAEGSAGVLRALRGLGEADRLRAADLAWEHAQLCMAATDYGAPEGRSNADFLGVHGPEEALASLGPGSVLLGERVPGGWHDLFLIGFYPPWEDEHGCGLVVASGRIVGCASPGDELGAFEVPGTP